LLLAPLNGDVQNISSKNGSFYSVSISGYHLAEAELSITQLAFTLSNGFTYEIYLSRGMSINDFGA
jgi:methylmalonyl-CoA mutase N-terminal domain/subunit